MANESCSSRTSRLEREILARAFVGRNQLYMRIHVALAFMLTTRRFGRRSRTKFGTFQRGSSVQQDGISLVGIYIQPSETTNIEKKGRSVFKQRTPCWRRLFLVVLHRGPTCDERGRSLPFGRLVWCGRRRLP